MPTPQQWSPEKLAEALDSGAITVALIDQALERRYVQMFERGIFDRPITQTPIDFAAGGHSAREIGTEGSVLLQNNGALPIASDVQDVLLIGKATQIYAQQAVSGGDALGEPMGSVGGSSAVVPNYTVKPVEGLEDVLAELGNTEAEVRLALVDDANETATIDGEAASYDEVLAAAAEAQSVVMMAGTMAIEGSDRATFTDTSGSELVESGDNLDWYAEGGLGLGGGAVTVDGTNHAKNSNTVAMVKDVMGASPAMAAKSTLVLKDNAGIEMDPALVGENGPAILEVWFPGQEDGHIVGDLLLGVQNPSGKTPFTCPFAGKGFMSEASAAQFPGVLVDGKQTVEYTEGRNIGYRWYDANMSGNGAVAEDGSNPCVAFPFGHGLSYTDFEITKPTVSAKSTDGTKPIKVQFFVQNTGGIAGSEVPQVYLSLPGEAGDSPKRLVGFEKVELAPGEKRRVSITIDPAATSHPFAVWDADADGWTTPTGEFQVRVGNSAGSAQSAGSVSVR